MTRGIGVFLYLPPGLRGLEIRGQGLVRHALTTSVALAREGSQPIVVVVPREFHGEVQSAVASMSPHSSLDLTVVAPREISPATRVHRALGHVRNRGHVRHGDGERAGRETGNLHYTQPGTVTRRGFTGWLRALTPRFATLSRMHSAIGTLLEREGVRHLARTANRCDVDVWWCPSTLFGGIDLLREPKVSTFADYSPAEFPSMIRDDPRLAARGIEMQRAIRASTTVVCLSEHVRDRHLAVLSPDALARTVVIPPGPPTRGAYRDVGDIAGPPLTIPAYAAVASLRPSSRAAETDWWHFPVITAPTQNRQYKNLTNLVIAVRILNADRGLRVRLVLTAQPSALGLGEFVEAEGCAPFVEFLTNLPEDALDSVLADSSLGITPSLFEGSLPFTLHESVSVGTPCLMADIPVTRVAGATDPRFLSLTLFDPHDPAAMADKIQWALSASSELLACQRAFLHGRQLEFGWPPTAARYLEAFDAARRKPRKVPA